MRADAFGNLAPDGVDRRFRAKFWTAAACLLGVFWIAGAAVVSLIFGGE